MDWPRDASVDLLHVGAKCDLRQQSLNKSKTLAAVANNCDRRS